MTGTNRQGCQPLRQPNAKTAAAAAHMAPGRQRAQHDEEVDEDGVDEAEPHEHAQQRLTWRRAERPAR